MKIALTGADGFIGSNLQYFLKPYYNVIPVTRKICNLLDAAQVHEFLKLHKFDVVINLALWVWTQHTQQIVQSKARILHTKNIWVFWSTRITPTLAA